MLLVVKRRYLRALALLMSPILKFLSYPSLRAAATLRCTPISRSAKYVPSASLRVQSRAA